MNVFSSAKGFLNSTDKVGPAFISSKTSILEAGNPILVSILDNAGILNALIDLESNPC